MTPSASWKLNHRLAMLTVLLLLNACATAPAKPALPEPSPATVSQLLDQGEQCELKGDNSCALLQYVKALQLDANSAEAHYRVARVHAQMGNLSTAQEAYARCLSLQPDHLAAKEGYGLLLLQGGRNTDARNLLTQVDSRDPSRWRTLNGLGVLADLQGDHVAAQVYFARALTLKADDAELLNNLGFSLYLSGDYAQARQRLQRALSVRPNYAKAWSNLGLLLARSGDYDRAVEAFEHVADPAAARYDAAYVCLLDGKREPAQRLLQAAIQASPSYYPAAQLALSQLQQQGAGNPPVRPAPRH